MLFNLIIMCCSTVRLEREDEARARRDEKVVESLRSYTGEADLLPRRGSVFSLGLPLFLVLRKDSSSHCFESCRQTGKEDNTTLVLLPCQALAPSWDWEESDGLLRRGSSTEHSTAQDGS